MTSEQYLDVRFVTGGDTEVTLKRDPKTDGFVTVGHEIRHMQQMKKLRRHHEQRVTQRLLTVICCVCCCLAWYEFAARHSNQHIGHRHSRQDWQLLLCSAQGH